jgi:hypothetical protein
MQRRIDPWLILALVILAGFAVLGTWNGFNDWQKSASRLQLITSIAQLSSGILALVALPALLIGWRGLRLVLRLWVLAVTLTGGLAPVAWGGATAGAGIAATILSCLIALAVIWIVRRAQVAP